MNCKITDCGNCIYFVTCFIKDGIQSKRRIVTEAEYQSWLTKNNLPDVKLTK